VFKLVGEEMRRNGAAPRRAGQAGGPERPVTCRGHCGHPDPAQIIGAHIPLALEPGDDLWVIEPGPAAPVRNADRSRLTNEDQLLGIRGASAWPTAGKRWQVGRPSFPVAAALSGNRVSASVQNPRSRFSQRSDCSISSSCLSRSANSIARRRNWCATAARRCSSSARRSSRLRLCASVCMGGRPSRGVAVRLQTPGSVRLVR
jgi:hypothetical protein